MFKLIAYVCSHLFPFALLGYHKAITGKMLVVLQYTFIEGQWITCPEITVWLVEIPSVLFVRHYYYREVGGL